MAVSWGRVVGGAFLVGVAAALAGSHSAVASRADATVPTIDLRRPLGSPAGDLATGPRANGTAVLPDGRVITPAGKEISVELQPLNELLSHDGKYLYVSSEGINDDPSMTSFGDGTHKRFLSVIDTQAGTVVAKVRDDALESGIAESPDGRRIYVSDGATDAVGVIDRSANGTFTLEAKSIKLDAGEKQFHVYPWGLSMSPDGKRLYAVGFISNTLYTVDLDAHDGPAHVVATTPTGQYPYAVLASPDGKRLYVSNWGQYNPGDLEYETTNLNSQINSPIVPPPAAIAGYNTPASSSVWSYDVKGGAPSVSVETPIGNQLNGTSVDGGSQPSALALAPDGHTLAVTSSNDDLVELLDTARTEPATELPSVAGGLGSGLASLSQHPARLVDLRVLGTTPTGAQPDALAWSPDGRVLLVAEAGRNTVAVVDPARVTATPTSAFLAPDPTTAAGQNRDAVIGRIPTAWYPDGLAVSADGRRVWILTDNGLGSGPNTDLGPDGKPITATYQDPKDPHHGGATDLAYIPDTLNGMVEQVDLATVCGDLANLSHASDLDNGLVQGAPAVDGTSQAALAGTGYVVPTGYGQPTSDGVPKIKHVFLIIKENRPFDQIFGDVPGNERDARFTDFGKIVTPNAHALVQQFASSDNYYVNSETSRDGHFSIDTGQVTEFLQKTVTSSYANKIPFFQGDTNPENIPEGGFIWDHASRAGVKSRVYGEGTYVVGVSPAVLGALGTAPALNPAGALIPGIDALNVSFDPLYPTQAPLPLQDDTGIYAYNDHTRAAAFQRDFADELAPFKSLPASAADDVVPPLNVMILFDDHTGGDIGNAPFPRDYVAENDDALGQVMRTISTSPVWHDSAVFVTEDDTQGGQDSVDAHRSFDMVLSPWANHAAGPAGYVSHVHTSFSSITKTIDLLLGIPPASLQELTATSLASEFVPGPAPGVPNAAPTVPQPEVYGGGQFGYTDHGAPNPAPLVGDRNFTVANAPNPALRLAAQIAPSVPAGIDQGGALAQYDLELEQEGLRQLGDPSASYGDAVEHTLARGSPAALVSATTAATNAAPSGVCLTSATPPVSVAPGSAAPPATGASGAGHTGSSSAPSSSSASGLGSPGAGPPIPSRAAAPATRPTGGGSAVPWALSVLAALLAVAAVARIVAVARQP